VVHPAAPQAGNQSAILLHLSSEEVFALGDVEGENVVRQIGVQRSLGPAPQAGDLPYVAALREQLVPEPLAEPTARPWSHRHLDAAPVYR